MKLLISFFVFVFVNGVFSLEKGEECTQSNCVSNRGFFTENSMTSHWKKYFRHQSKTFVFKFSGIEDPAFLAEIWIKSHYYGSFQKVDEISGGGDKIVALKAYEVSITIFSIIKKVQFTVEYFAGCDLVTKIQEYPASLNVESSCSIFVPRIYDSSSRQHTDATGVFLKNVPAGLNVTLDDIITGENILNVDNATEFEFGMPEKNSSVSFYTNLDSKLSSVSSIFLLTFETSDDVVDLTKTTFDYYALSEYENECFNKERDCEYGLLDELTYIINCNKRKCPVFEKLISLIPTEIDDLSGRSSVPSYCKKKKFLLFPKIGFNTWKRNVCIRLKDNPLLCDNLRRRTRSSIVSGCRRAFCINVKKNFCEKKDNQLFS